MFFVYLLFCFVLLFFSPHFVVAFLYYLILSDANFHFSFLGSFFLEKNPYSSLPSPIYFCLLKGSLLAVCRCTLNKSLKKTREKIGRCYMRHVPVTEQRLGSNPSPRVRVCFIEKHCLPSGSCLVPQEQEQRTPTLDQGHTLTPWLWFCTAT